MLTLNPITLFYHSLREASRAINANTENELADWAERVVSNKSAKSKSGIRSISTPSLAGKSQRTEPSTIPAPSSRSALSSRVGVKVVHDGNNNGGLSDHEEIKGEECKVARNSPVKMGRATSTVSNNSSFGSVS